MMAEMKGDKTAKLVKEVKEAVEAKFNLELEEVVAENTIGKTAAEKKAWRDGWLAWHKKTAAEKRALCEDKDPWHLCGQGCKDLRDEAIDDAHDEAIAIRRARKNPRLEEIVPDGQRVQVIQGNCSSSGVLCCEECARYASG